MRSNYEKIIQSLGQTEPPPNLYEGIMARIKIERARKARRQAVIMGFITLFSSVAVIPALRYMAQEFHNSGFFQYLSLLFSDSNLIMADWKNFALLLVEATPLLAVVAVLSATLLMLYSLKSTTKNIRKAFYPRYN